MIGKIMRASTAKEELLCGLEIIRSSMPMDMAYPAALPRIDEYAMFVELYLGKRAFFWGFHFSRLWQENYHLPFSLSPYDRSFNTAANEISRFLLIFGRKHGYIRAKYDK